MRFRPKIDFRSPLVRLRIGGTILASVFIVSTLGYRLLGYPTWIDAAYMTVITIFSVGYGETSQLDGGTKLFTIAVIVFGITSAGYTLGASVQLLVEGELERALGRRRMDRDIEKLQNHVILCGYGRMGQMLAADLRRNKRPFVVIENDPQRAEEAVHAEHLCIHADATEDEILLRAGVQRAHSLVSALPNDAANVFITLTARNLNRDLQIVARAEHRSSERKLQQAGADRVVMPAAIGAQKIVRMITRPSTADLMDMLADQGNLDLELDELHVPVGNPLVGMSVRDTEANRKYHLLVLAVKQLGGRMIFHPEADYRFQAGDVVIAMGQTENIARFRTETGL